MGEHPLNVIHQENINFIFVTYYDYRQDQKKQKKVRISNVLHYQRLKTKKNLRSESIPYAHNLHNTYKH